MKATLPRTPLHGCGRTPLVAAFATAFALAAPAAMATTWTVDNCNEAVSVGPGSNTGSLRFAANNALDGDTIDMTGLTCGTITLATGAIVFKQNNLAVNGPVIDKLLIDCVQARGSYRCTDRIFDHTGSGVLQVHNLTVLGGHIYSKTQPATGGCIYSSGSLLYLDHVVVGHCSVTTNGQAAQGGGIFAKNALALKYSNVAGNIVSVGSTGSQDVGAGGGVFAGGDFEMASSTISNNQAFTSNPVVNQGSHGGGLALAGNVQIESSTISGNHSDYDQGGIDIYNTHPSSLTTLILNSTISGNSATNVAGGLYVNSGKVNLYNSTIASNTTGKGAFRGVAAAPGMAIGSAESSMTVTLQSSLLANNTYGPSPAVDNDLSTETFTHTITFNAASANNLVYRTSVPVGTLPPDTLFSCPQLGPLRNNGGLTQTHALLSRSPAIGAGNNSQNLKEDQRGLATDTAPYPYPRVTRVSPIAYKTDIGAYELIRADFIFNNGFDGCP